MKALIEAIRARLQSGLGYVRAADVFVTEDDNLIPEAVKFPAVGLKDGAIARTELAGGWWRVNPAVRLVVWVQLQKTEAGVMGDDASGQKGVLEIADDIHALLDQNLLGIEGMQGAFSPSEGESQFVGDEQLVLQRKVIEYRYELEEVRAGDGNQD